MSYPLAQLRVHSDYSMSRGASKVKDVVKRARALGYGAVALTDDEALHGAMDLAKHGEAEGIQTIVGTKVYMPTSKKGTGRGSLILLAQTDLGYANVCGLLNMDLTPGRPRVGVLDADSVRRILASMDDGSHGIAADVICLAGAGADSLLGAVYRESGTVQAEANAALLKRVFPGRFYVEICRDGFPDAKAVETEREILDVAMRLGLPIVATSEACYATEDRHDAYSILRAVADSKRGGLRANEAGVAHESPVRLHLRSPGEMEALFHDLPEALENTSFVAMRCASKARKRKPILPPYETEGGRSEAEELRIQAREGLDFRLAATPPSETGPYHERLDFELRVIEGMGFPGYFLIVSDFIKYAKSQDIPVGPGRGSGAGSVVAWALLITDLDPLRFGLLFERFLNPDRVSMPDFDIDFCETRRQDVIHYVERKYTRERVAQIATFAEIKTKSGLRDVARVLVHSEHGGLSQMEINNIANMVPAAKNGKELKLREVYEQVPDFARKIDENPRARIVYDNTLKVEGLFRQTATHAAGIVIAGDTLTHLVPVGFDPKTGFPVVQLNMKDTENVGLVKFDFLALTTLSVMKEAVAHIRDIEGTDLDIASLPLDDGPTLKLFAEGRTTGLFQFESEGMKRSLKDVRADRIEDLIAVNALYRPGPMQFIPSFAARKNGRETPVYPEPVDKTKPFLEETFGIMVYQEQVMQVAQVVAGYSLGGADLLRRAMGKKIKSEMDAQKETFVQGAARTNNMTERKASALFDDIAKFADYGFNKSHAAAYSLVAYQTGYLKAHHPVSFFAALLSFESEVDRMTLIKQDMDSFGIAFLRPDVNASFTRFMPERLPDGKLGLRFGLMAVKNVSAASIDPMVEERTRNGPFRDLVDFHVRVGHMFNSGQLTKLAEAGAFSSLDPNRNRSHEILSFMAKNHRKDLAAGDLFGEAGRPTYKPHLDDTQDWPDVVGRELGAVGFFLGKHPLEDYETPMRRRGGRRRQAIIQWMIDKKKPDDKGRKLYGMVEDFELRPGNRGAFVRIKLQERKETYWINVFVKDPETAQRLLVGAKDARKPVVVIAQFSPGNNGPGDMYVKGYDVHLADDYIREHWMPSVWNIEYDKRVDPNMRPSERARIAALDEKAHAGPPAGVSERAFEDACYSEYGEIIRPDVENFLRQYKARVEQDGVTDATDEVLFTIRMNVGPFEMRYEVKPQGKVAFTEFVKLGLKQMPGVASLKES